MSRIFWDTNLFIYLFEGYGELSEKVQSGHERMLQRGDQLLTSTLTLGELSVKSTEKGAADLCKRYERALSTTAVLLPFDAKVAVQYARLRSKYSAARCRSIGVREQRDSGFVHHEPRTSTLEARRRDLISGVATWSPALTGRL
jgi:predicted nucleic acid-binding protein